MKEKFFTRRIPKIYCKIVLLFPSFLFSSWQKKIDSVSVSYSSDLQLGSKDMKKVSPTTTYTCAGTARLNTGFRTAVQLLRMHAQTLNLVAGAMGKAFTDFAGMLGVVQGRILVAGAGANDCVARHTARKFSSSGIPSLFAGMDSFGGDGISWLIQQGDAVLLFAGREDAAFREDVMFAASRMDIPLFLITGQEDTSDGNLHILKLSGTVPPGGEREDSPLVYMALGEALAQEICRIRGMKDSSSDAAKTLGGSRFRRVSEIMRKGDELPLLKGDAVLAEARTLLRRHAPCVVGVMKRDKLSGVISDADFRRMGSRIELDTPVTKAMRPPTATLTEDDSVAEALRLLRESGASALFVLRDRRPVGLVGPYDCLKA